MKLKIKLTLTYGFMFTLILLLGGVGIYYLQWLAKDSRAIIRENYRTMHYMQNLEKDLGDLQGIVPGLRKHQNVGNQELQQILASIENNLSLQQENITESGENKLTNVLIEDYGALTALLDSFNDARDKEAFFIEKISPLLAKMEEQTDSIYSINEQALLHKNDIANNTADTLTTYMAIVCGTAVVLAFLFLLRIPELISRPIYRLKEGIRQVEKGNYAIKLEVNSKNEFGELADSFNKMAGKLSEYVHSNYANLLFEKRRMDAVINQMSDAVIGLDESKHIIFINAYALELLGFEKENVIGKYAPDLALNSPFFYDLIAGLMVGGISDKKLEKQSIKASVNGKQRWFSKSVVNISDKVMGEDRTMLVGHVIILSDITEFSEKDQAKTQFIATLSHELKTPIAAIQMSTILLSNNKVGKINEEQQDLIGTITDNIDRMQRITSEILDVSKIESGVVEVAKVVTGVKELTDKAIEGVEAFTKEKKIGIRTEVAPDLPPVSVDPHKTIWVLNNFLTNAIRYTPEGEVITIRAEEHGKHVVISVEDKGPGISAENQPRVFMPFFRVAGDQSEGTGLGLAISKEFVYAMNGDIGLRSEEGQGSVFYISFPSGEVKA